MNLRLNNISLPLAPYTLQMNVELRGRVVALFGPSGAGKTSLLDLIAGLRRPVSGSIQFDKQIWTDAEKNIFVPPFRRAIGYVPQDLALFPHLSVRGNLIYGHKSVSSHNISFLFDRVAEILEIQPLVSRAVTDLSGGEKQRVAIARALLSMPRLLLLDEPLASLDVALKSKIISHIARVRDEFDIPMLYVTHDRSEVQALADEVVVLAGGMALEVSPASSATLGETQ